MKKRRIREITLGVLLCAGIGIGFLPSQENTDSEYSQLFRDTLPMDINSSSFSELSDWCNRLEISSRGTRAELIERLFKYYKVKPEEPEEKDDTTIRIESAANTEYFSLEEFEEDYVRLDGGVHLIMEDKKKGYIYTIYADSVLFNRSLKLLSATGNVDYRITGEGRDEKFLGESITINLNTWEGYFFNGASVRERTVSDEALNFQIKGEFISRSTKDFVVMENAEITSSEKLPANYSIKADKIWIFGPKEWGVDNATLYVGHIPIFYFPFFFYPGDEVIFHPVFGYKTREGSFIQTTTYFLGNRKPSDTPLSFLQLTDQGDNDKIKERHGIFLRDTEEKLRNPEQYIKGLFDIYSRLGVYMGIEGDLPNMIDGVKTFNFKGGLGFSQNLYTNTVPGLSGAYTPYWIEDDGSLSTHWNSTYIGSQELPFRYGGESSLSLTEGAFSLSLLLESYSDPYFTEDFSSRKEQIDWSKLFEGVFEDETTTTLKDSLTWRINGSYTPSFPSLSPYITSFSVSQYLVSLGWRSKDTSEDLLPSYSTVDPTRRFFYPDTLSIPEVSLNMGGTLYSYSGSAVKPKPGSQEKQSGQQISKEFLPPWKTGQDQDPDEKEESEEDLKIPVVRPDTALTPFALPLGFNLRYDLRPKIVYEAKTNSTDWDEPSDAEYRFSLASLTLQNSVSLSGEMKLYDTLLQTKDTLTFSSQYRDVNFLDDSYTETEKSSYRLSAYQYSSLSLTNNFDAATYPLFKTELFPGSNLKYYFNSIFYKKSYSHLDESQPVYEDTYFDFSQQTITSHKTTLELKMDVLPITPKITASYILPPLDEVLTFGPSIVAGPSTSSVTFTTKKLEDRWVNQPLTFEELITVGDFSSFRTTYLYDFEEETPYSLSSSLRLWALNMSFNAKYTEPYTFGGTSTGWVKEDEKEFIPSDASIGLNYLYKPDPMWKNRVRVTSGVNLNWQMNLIRFTDTSLNIGFDFVFSLYKFLDLKFSTVSKNTMMYQYFPDLANKVDRSPRNPLTDLFNSFNFFDSSARYDSFFKISSISLEAVHHLDDWDLTVSYTGSPELLTNSDGSSSFSWNGILGIYLQWKPIPEIKSEFRYDKDGLEY